MRQRLAARDRHLARSSLLGCCWAQDTPLGLALWARGTTSNRAPPCARPLRARIPRASKRPRQAASDEQSSAHGGAGDAPTKAHAQRRPTAQHDHAPRRIARPRQPRTCASKQQSASSNLGLTGRQGSRACKRTGMSGLPGPTSRKKEGALTPAAAAYRRFNTKWRERERESMRGGGAPRLAPACLPHPTPCWLPPPEPPPPALEGYRAARGTRQHDSGRPHAQTACRQHKAGGACSQRAAASRQPRLPPRQGAAAIPHPLASSWPPPPASYQPRPLASSWPRRRRAWPPLPSAREHASPGPGASARARPAASAPCLAHVLMSRSQTSRRKADAAQPGPPHEREGQRRRGGTPSGGVRQALV